MKRLIYGVLFVLLAWTAYQNETVRDFVEQGPGEYLAKLRNFLHDYSPEALEREFADSLQPALLAAGVQAMVYRPDIARFRLRRHRLRRLHRKLAVIDGEIAYVGGINVIDDLNTPYQIPPRYDYAVRIEGPMLVPIQQAQHRLWEMLSGSVPYT